MFSLAWKSLFPDRCLICAGSDIVRDGVCSLCRSSVQPLPDPVCDTCGTPVGTPGTCIGCTVRPPAYDRCLSACRFEGTVREVIHRFKYRHATVYKRFLAGLLFSVISEKGIRADILTPVPLHWSRLVLRGYNQSSLIARELSRYMKTDVRYGILRKTRKTPRQAGLSKKDRGRNLRRAFSAGRVEGKSVMVVDDVITTGSTAQEVSRALKDAGAAQVIFVSVGRAVT
ncbi:MAG TPA: ComF family protein [Deltaproteobacteria bacterium]|nr:ComF family protein [Deltaproteobacteria bacterium]HOI07658.1 ComF family protein [Deltaproteobacteria bacterium]